MMKETKTHTLLPWLFSYGRGKADPRASLLGLLLFLLLNAVSLDFLFLKKKQKALLILVLCFKGRSTIRKQIFISVLLETQLYVLRYGLLVFIRGSVAPGRKAVLCCSPRKLPAHHRESVSGATHLMRWSDSLLGGTQLGLNFYPFHPLIACQLHFNILHLFLRLECSC